MPMVTFSATWGGQQFSTRHVTAQGTRRDSKSRHHARDILYSDCRLWPWELQTCMHPCGKRKPISK